MKNYTQVIEELGCASASLEMAMNALDDDMKAENLNAFDKKILGRILRLQIQADAIATILERKEIVENSIEVEVETA